MNSSIHSNVLQSSDTVSSRPPCVSSANGLSPLVLDRSKGGRKDCHWNREWCNKTTDAVNLCGCGVRLHNENIRRSADIMKNGVYWDAATSTTVLFSCHNQHFLKPCAVIRGGTEQHLLLAYRSCQNYPVRSHPSIIVRYHEHNVHCLTYRSNFPLFNDGYSCLWVINH
jgi:hypothetical protein